MNFPTVGKKSTNPIYTNTIYTRATIIIRTLYTIYKNKTDPNKTLY